MENTGNTKKNEVLKMSNAESNLFTKDCIRTALLSLMATEMFEQITVTSIIKRAGVSRGGFYRNYTSKEEVLREIGEELFEYLLEFVSQHKIHDNPKEWFFDFFQTVFDYKEEYKLLIRTKVPAGFVFHFDEEKLLKEVQKDDSSLEHYRAIAMGKALQDVTLAWFQKGMKETPEEMAEVMYQIFFGRV